GAGVGAGALAAGRQAAAVAEAAVRADVAQPGDVLLHLAAERALDGVLAVEQRGQPADLFVGEFLGPPLRVDAGLLAQAQGQRRPDAVDVAQRNVGRLVVRNVHALDTRHTL